MMLWRCPKRTVATILIVVAYLILGLFSSTAAAEYRSLWPCQDDARNEIDWRARVLNVLLPDVPRDTTFRCVVIPSFEPEWVILADCETDASARLELRIASENVWFANWVPMPTDEHPTARIWSDIPVPVETEVHQISLSSDTCVVLRNLWSAILKHPNPWGGPGVDGTEYVFFAGSGSDESCGEIWSPRNGTFLRRLVELVEDLRRHAQNTDQTSRRKRDDQLRERALQLTKDRVTRAKGTN